MIGIVSIIVGSILILSIAGMIQDYNLKRMKLEAALREEEMRRGYMPGTYSRSFSSKKAYKEMKRYNKKVSRNKGNAEDFRMPGVHEDPMEKEDLERAINDLEQRINNLDTIMKERKNGKV